MNIRHRSAIHDAARSALGRAEDHKKIPLIYGIVCCALSLAATVLTSLLSDGISGTGGLSNFGLRSVLSTGQSVLPLVNLAVTACLTMGYHVAILSITRGFDASPRTLLSGFRHLGLVLRALLFQSLIYMGAGMASVYISSFVFMATPFSEPFLEAVEPYLSTMISADGTVTVDEAMLAAAADSLVPMLVICAVVCLMIFIPLWYRFRMVNFCMADDPGKGALYAMSMSRRLMRRNSFALFRLDLELWWYYLGQLLITLVCYGDVFLALAGISLPWGDSVSYWLFFGLSMAGQLVLYFLAMNRVYSVYAVAYDTLQESLVQPNFPVQM